MDFADVFIIILCLFILVILVVSNSKSKNKREVLTPKKYRKFFESELENKSPEEMVAKCREIIESSDDIIKIASAQFALYYLEHPEAMDKRYSSQ